MNILVYRWNSYNYIDIIATFQSMGHQVDVIEQELESYDEDGDGAKRTDYSFRFAKRFYNDRIRIVLGGRISTGEDINQGQAQPFIDNVSIEYRLDPSGTRYVKLFHNKDYESLLEGELTETGAGIVLHKKMQYMRELFIFKRNKTKPQKEENNKEKTKEDEN